MNPAARVRRAVRAALESVGLARGKLLVVAVSGGPDSLALLHALHSLSGELGLRLHGAHLDHALRGAASDADARFVAGEFRRLRVAHTCERADVAAYRRAHKLSLEEAAREVRYDFLARVAAQNDADAVALGHTADDQAETVLMRLLRGSGLAGLRGMRTLSARSHAIGEIALVRPLLAVPRADTVAFCREQGLSPRRDASNESTEMLRNRVRLELIPQLESYNPAVRQALLRLARSSARDMAYIEGQVDAALPAVASRTPGGVTLDRAAFARLHPSIQAHLVRRAYAIVRGESRDLEQYHLDETVRLMGGSAGKSLALPGGVTFAVGYDQATLTLDDPAPCPLPLLEGRHRLAIPGNTTAGEWQVSAAFAERDGPDERTRDAESGPPYTALLDAAGIGDTAWLRTREPGERFQPLGMTHTKKLQDFMVDAKIPREWRGRVPLLVTPRGVAWVAGHRIAHWARARNGSQALRVRLELDSPKSLPP